MPATIRAFRVLPNCGKCGNCVDNMKPRIADLLPPDLARTLGAVKSASPALALGIAAFDEEMKGGIPTSALTEIFGETGQGSWWLGLRALAAVREKAVAIIEPAGTFFAPGAASVGVDLSRLLVLRESNRRQALWALERIVKDKSVGATLAHIEGMGETEMRRLQLAAESSGQALILLREEQRLSRASWGALRLRVSSEPGDSERRIIVETLRARGGFAPRPILIEIEHGTMAVRASSVLPHRADFAGLAKTA
jgi:protein ImuA